MKSLVVFLIVLTFTLAVSTNFNNGGNNISKENSQLLEREKSTPEIFKVKPTADFIINSNEYSTEARTVHKLHKKKPHQPLIHHHHRHQPHYPMHHYRNNEGNMEMEEKLTDGQNINVDVNEFITTEDHHWNLEKYIHIAKKAIDSIEEHFMKIEKKTVSLSDWKISESDKTIHEGIQTAKDALNLIQRGVSDFEKLHSEDMLTSSTIQVAKLSNNEMINSLKNANEDLIPISKVAFEHSKVAFENSKEDLKAYNPISKVAFEDDDAEIKDAIEDLKEKQDNGALIQHVKLANHKPHNDLEITEEDLKAYNPTNKLPKEFSEEDLKAYHPISKVFEDDNAEIKDATEDLKEKQDNGPLIQHIKLTNHKPHNDLEVTEEDLKAYHPTNKLPNEISEEDLKAYHPISKVFEDDNAEIKDATEDLKEKQDNGPLIQHIKLANHKPHNDLEVTEEDLKAYHPTNKLPNEVSEEDLKAYHPISKEAFENSEEDITAYHPISKVTFENSEEDLKAHHPTNKLPNEVSEEDLKAYYPISKVFEDDNAEIKDATEYFKEKQDNVPLIQHVKLANHKPHNDLEVTEEDLKAYHPTNKLPNEISEEDLKAYHPISKVFEDDNAEIKDATEDLKEKQDNGPLIQHIKLTNHKPHNDLEVTEEDLKAYHPTNKLPNEISEEDLKAYHPISKVFEDDNAEIKDATEDLKEKQDNGPLIQHIKLANHKPHNDLEVTKLPSEVSEEDLKAYNPISKVAFENSEEDITAYHPISKVPFEINEEDIKSYRPISNIASESSSKIKMLTLPNNKIMQTKHKEANIAPITTESNMVSLPNLKTMHAELKNAHIEPITLEPQALMAANELTAEQVSLMETKLTQKLQNVPKVLPVDGNNISKMRTEHRWEMFHPHTQSRGAYGLGGMGASYGNLNSGSGSVVGVFPNANKNCAIPLLVSCSPSIVSGSVSKHINNGHNAPVYRASHNFIK